MNIKLLESLQKITSETDFTKKINAFYYFDYISQIIKDYFSGEIRSFLMRFTGDELILTRVRKNIGSGSEGLFSNYTKLWYPPADKAPFGRANFEKKSIFYCSNDPATSVFEIKPRLNDWISSIEINFTKPELTFFRLGIEDEETLSKLNENEQALNKFFSQIFKQVVPSDTPHLYYPSAIITNLFIHDFDGIVYPSVASNLKGFNFAIKTEIVDTYAKIRNFLVQEVIQYNNPLDFRLKCKYQPIEMGIDGNITWHPIENCEGHNLTEKAYHKI